jgi:hypothetical protein
MRLLHIKELRFGEFFDNYIPECVILSRKWGNDEISYQTLNSIIEISISDLEKVSHPKLSGSGGTKSKRFALVQESPCGRNIRQCGSIFSTFRFVPLALSN